MPFPGSSQKDFSKEMLANRNLDESKKLNPQLQSFDQWLANNKDKVSAATQPAPAAS